jgi:hypothetical protein
VSSWCCPCSWLQQGCTASAAQQWQLAAGSWWGFLTLDRSSLPELLAAAGFEFLFEMLDDSSMVMHKLQGRLGGASAQDVQQCLLQPELVLNLSTPC